METRTQQIRSTLLKLMLGCVIVAAVVAIVAVLAGSMGNVGENAIWTVLSALIHVVVLFGIISTAATNDPRLARSTNIAINTSMVVAVLSFFTSVLGVWGVLDTALAVRLYVTYVVVLFVVLHGKTLMDVEAVYDRVRPYVLANYGVMLLVAGLILGAVYSPDAAELLRTFYGRLLAASAIVDVTLSVVIAGMHRLYLQQHPEVAVAQQGQPQGSAHSWVKVLLVIVFFFFFGGPLLFGLIVSALLRQ